MCSVSRVYIKITLSIIKKSAYCLQLLINKSNTHTKKKRKTCACTMTSEFELRLKIDFVGIYIQCRRTRLIRRRKKVGQSITSIKITSHMHTSKTNDYEWPCIILSSTFLTRNRNQCTLSECTSIVSYAYIYVCSHVQMCKSNEQLIGLADRLHHLYIPKIVIHNLSITYTTLIRDHVI